MSEEKILVWHFYERQESVLVQRDRSRKAIFLSECRGGRYCENYS